MAVGALASDLRGGHRALGDGSSEGHGAAAFHSVRRRRVLADGIVAVIVAQFDQGSQVFKRVEFFVLAFRVLLGFVLGGFGLGW